MSGSQLGRTKRPPTDEKPVEFEPPCQAGRACSGRGAPSATKEPVTIVTLSIDLGAFNFWIGGLDWFGLDLTWIE